MTIDELRKTIKEKEAELKELKQQLQQMKFDRNYFDYTIDTYCNGEYRSTHRKSGSKESLERVMNTYKRMVELGFVEMRYVITDNRTKEVMEIKRKERCNGKI